VNYALREVDAVWKIYDVRIDGVSYVQNYRNQFGAEISALGLEAVIERLESGA
jgi:phospholipid transport system substrate-binding protein